MNVKQQFIETTRYIKALINRPIAAILMFHRINIPQEHKIGANEHLKVSPQYLEEFILKAKLKGFSFVSLDELYDVLILKKSAKRLLSITLDDGYLDNVEYGLPVFKKHQVPFCIYITTKMIEKQFIYWWYLIEELILKHDQVMLSNGVRIDCSCKQKAFLQIRNIIRFLPQDNLLEQLKSLFKNYSLNWHAYNNEYPLTWEHISSLNKDSLVTIGCHTHSHYVFSKASDQAIIEDVQQSINLMTQKGGKSPTHFAFPFGDSFSVKAKHYDLMKKFDFKTLATTQNMFCGQTTSTKALPRVFISENNGMSFLKQFESLS